MTTVISALPTVFTDRGRVDWGGCERLFEAFAGFGLDGAFVAGSTGEFAALHTWERAQIARLALDVLGPEQTILHTGAADIDEVRRLIDDARSAGTTRVAVITPFMISVGDAALVHHYEQVAAHAEGLSLFMYVYPSITGVHVSAPVMAEIAQLPGVVGAKVSAQPLSVLAGYRAAVGPDFTLLTGSDGDLAGTGAAGVDGVVSGVSVAFPQTFAALKHQLETGGAPSGDAADAVTAAVAAIDGSLARIKLALHLRGLPGGASRQAVEPIADPVRRELESAVQRLG